MADFLLCLSPLATWHDAVGSLSDFVEVVRRQRGALVMGVVNVTPDSFYDGGRYADAEAAQQQVDKLIEEGADIIDIGAESTRPGAVPVPAPEQLKRAEPAIRRAAARGAWVSIDTQSPEVARYAVEWGATMINDVSCLNNPDLAQVAASTDTDLIIMHSRGSMTEMPGFSRYPQAAYEDVVDDVAREWKHARERAETEGVLRNKIWFDPGLGFHKSAAHSIELLARLDEFRDMGAKIAVGPSRKSFVGSFDGAKAEQRLGGTIAACLRAVDAGSVLLRVHDVQAVRQALLAHRAFSPRSRGAHHA